MNGAFAPLLLHLAAGLACDSVGLGAGKDGALDFTCLEFC